MLTEKQKEKYLETNQFQKDCTSFNDKMNELITNHVEELSNNKFDKFSEIVLPTLFIHHISNYFEHNLVHSEESANAFVSSIKATIMDNCNIQPEFDDYKLIDDMGAVA